MTLRIRPSSKTDVSRLQAEVTPPKLCRDSKASRPRKVLAVALLPLPIFPSKTTVLLLELDDSAILRANLWSGDVDLIMVITAAVVLCEWRFIFRDDLEHFSNLIVIL